MATIDRMCIQVYIRAVGKRYSIADARKNLPGIVTEAESGAGVELTRRGRPVAVVMSIHEYERIKGHRRDFKEAYAEFLERHDLAEIGLDDGFSERLRDRDAGRKVDL